MFDFLNVFECYVHSNAATRQNLIEMHLCVFVWKTFSDGKTSQEKLAQFHSNQILADVLFLKFTIIWLNDQRIQIMCFTGPYH